MASSLARGSIAITLLFAHAARGWVAVPQPPCRTHASPCVVHRPILQPQRPRRPLDCCAVQHSRTQPQHISMSLAAQARSVLNVAIFASIVSLLISPADVLCFFLDFLGGALKLGWRLAAFSVVARIVLKPLMGVLLKFGLRMMLAGGPIKGAPPPPRERIAWLHAALTASGLACVLAPCARVHVCSAASRLLWHVCQRLWRPRLAAVGPRAARSPRALLWRSRARCEARTESRIVYPLLVASPLTPSPDATATGRLRRPHARWRLFGRRRFWRRLWRRRPRRRRFILRARGRLWRSRRRRCRLWRPRRRLWRPRRRLWRPRRRPRRSRKRAARPAGGALCGQELLAWRLGKDPIKDKGRHGQRE